MVDHTSVSGVLWVLQVVGSFVANVMSVDLEIETPKGRCGRRATAWGRDRNVSGGETEEPSHVHLRGQSLQNPTTHRKFLPRLGGRMQTPTLSVGRGEGPKEI